MDTTSLNRIRNIAVSQLREDGFAAEADQLERDWEPAGFDTDECFVCDGPIVPGSLCDRGHFVGRG